MPDPENPASDQETDLSSDQPTLTADPAPSSETAARDAFENAIVDTLDDVDRELEALGAALESELSPDTEDKAPAASEDEAGATPALGEDSTSIADNSEDLPTAMDTAIDESPPPPVDAPLSDSPGVSTLEQAEAAAETSSEPTPANETDHETEQPTADSLDEPVLPEASESANEIEAAPSAIVDEPVPGGSGELALNAPESAMHAPVEDSPATKQEPAASSTSSETPATPAADAHPPQDAGAAAVDVKPAAQEQVTAEAIQPERKSKRGVLVALATGPLQVFIWLLIVIDAPFAKLGGKPKAAIGYLGLATSVVAAATWIAGRHLRH